MLGRQHERRSLSIRAAYRVALFMFLCAFGLAVAGPIGNRDSIFPAELAIGQITSVWTFALTILFVRWEGLRLVDVGAAPTNSSLPRALSGFALGLGLLGVWAVLCALTGPVRWSFTKDSTVATLGVFALAYVLLACREELAFHGYPLRRLDRSFGMWVAQIVVALVFVAEHRLGGMSWARALLGPGVGSILFGMAALSTRGLAVPVGLHAGWNTGHWSIGLKSQGGLWRGVVPPGQEDRAEFVAMVCYLAVMGIATIVFWFRYLALQQTEKRNSASGSVQS